MKNTFLRHQILLMKLIKTQAKNTRRVLKQAEKYLIDVVLKNKTSGIKPQLGQILKQLPALGLVLLYDLASYEAEFTTKQLRKLGKNIRPLDIEKIVLSTKVPTTLFKESYTVKVNYELYAKSKVKQYCQIISDAQVNREDVTITCNKVKEVTSGLFNTQNSALAHLAVIGVANSVRKSVIFNAY